MKSLPTVLAALAIGVLTTGDTSAQSMFSSGSNNLFGGRSLGSFNSGNFGLGGTGSAAVGGRTLQQPNLQTLGGSVFSAGQFQVGARTPGDFVGARQDAQDFVGAATTGQEFRPDTIGTTSRRGSTANRSGAGTGGAGTRTELRTSVSVGFTHPRPTPAEVQESLADRILRLGRLQMRSPLEVSVQGRTATLRGTVATEHERILAEQMVRLEPGIWTVNNELVLEAVPVPAGEPP